MRRFLLLILLLTGAYAIAVAQETATVESIEVSGIDDQQLSSNLQDNLRQQLEGRPFDQITADQLAVRIQEEFPEYVVAVRAQPGAQPNMVRVVFVAARISEDHALESNINARYPVEAVELEGTPRTQISDQLYNDMQSMVGQRLDNDEAERLGKRLASELGPRYQVDWKVERSVQLRQLRVLYEVFRIPLLPAREPRSFLGYHSQQGFSFALNTGVGFKPGRTQSLTFGATNNGDDLIERYAGFRVGYENVRLGTDRLGLKLDYSSYRNQWSVHTTSPDIYRRRRNLEASLSFALSTNLFLTTGILGSELEMEDTGDFEPSRAGVGAVRYERTFEDDGVVHRVDVGYDVHAGAGSLDSAFVYTRHAWDGHYEYENEDHTVDVRGIAGRITGNAPMFERFVLGNTRTLRGWNKFDFAPSGGDRVAYGSLEYHFKKLQVFYNVGALWESGDPVKVRPSIGFGLGESDEEFFLGIAVPFRESGMRPAFMLVCRFRAF